MLLNELCILLLYVEKYKNRVTYIHLSLFSYIFLYHYNVHEFRVFANTIFFSIEN